MAGLGEERDVLVFLYTFWGFCLVLLELAIDEMPQYDSHCLLQHDRYLIHFPSILFLLLLHDDPLNQPHNRLLDQPLPISQPQPKPLDDHDLKCQYKAQAFIDHPKVEGVSIVPDEIMQIDEVELYIRIVVIDDLLNGYVHFFEIALFLQPAMHDELQQEVLHLLLHAV